jgi:hypothetical protein
MTEPQAAQAPWYRTARRWSQTNLTESDPLKADPDAWRPYWREARIQGIIVNAGGIVAYYPSEFPLHYRARHLGDRDLFGEFVRAGREEGLAVLARMDINRATQDFYDEHPEWFVTNPDGTPHSADGRYFSCVNSDYYRTYIPAVLKEIIDRYRPDGFTDNSWTGVGRRVICHCPACVRKFRDDCGADLPPAADWNDPAYRRWVAWSYDCRMENWDLFNRVTREHGGPDCLWLGMVNANPMAGHGQFADLRAAGERAPIVMCDHQSRDALNGFEQNGVNGALLHALAGWDAIVPESMANYTRGVRTFRLGSNPPKETQLWTLTGFSGGISPWVHHIAAVQEDRRQLRNLPNLLQWHEQNEDALYDREPLATVGLLWSQANTDYYGRDNPGEETALPWHGWVRALTRARIPFVPVHADHIARETAKGRLRTLVLPELAVLTDAQAEALAAFSAGGGNLVVTGASGTLDGLGEPRTEQPLAALTGVRLLGRTEGALEMRADWAYEPAHNYIRLPEDGTRHPIVSGFMDTDLLPLGGRLHRVELHPSMQTLATYVPPFPIYPPEFSWMREPQTDWPAIAAGTPAGSGRVCYLAADLDRSYGRTHLPDQGDVLSAAVRWAAGDTLPLQVEGPGYLQCAVYRQAERMIVQLVNLSGANAYPGYVEEWLPVGPIRVAVRLQGSHCPVAASLRVAGGTATVSRDGDWAIVELPSLTSHELLVLG